MSNIREIITLADLDLLDFLLRDYRAQIKAIEDKGGWAGHSRSVEEKLVVLMEKLGGIVP